jgi:hypothetical protein
MKHFLYFLLFCFAGNLLNGQDGKVAFLDENYEIITEASFNKKNNSTLYYSKRLITDSVTYDRLSFKYYLGVLDKKLNEQLFSILKQRNNVDTTKTIIIHYKDTLPPVSSFPKKDSIVYHVNGTHRHVNSHKTFKKIIRGCIRANDRRKSVVYHFYNVNNDYPLQTTDLLWHKDNLQLLRKLFYDRNSGNFNWFIILQTNGNYLVDYYGVNSKIFTDVKKGKNWEIHYNDFQRRYKSLN